MSARLHLGFEVGTGNDVEIPLRHMVVSGQTQEAGKTTTMEALIHRAKLPAIAFITKRGERSFGDAHRLPPYFRERADWQFVASVLEATLREKMKFERSWIIKASKGATTLADVQRNVREALKKASGLSESVYTTLDAYLDIVVPRIQHITWSKSIELGAGVNVMDVADRDSFPAELQALVMQSALEWVYEKCDGTITIIPEAWEFLPQGRGSPVKLSAVQLIRKGAGLRNFVWLDSQDIGGVDKELLRHCPVWLLGVQREANEIERTLDNIPANVRKPKAADIAKLKIGQFFACYGEHVVKTYVQPAWMTVADARAIASGTMTIEQAANARQISHRASTPTMSNAVEQKLDVLIGLMTAQQQQRVEISGPGPFELVKIPPATPTPTPTNDEEALYQRFKARLIEELPGDARVLQIITARPELRVEVRKQVIEVDGSTLRGRLALLVVSDFFDQAQTTSTALAELAKRGFTTAAANVARELGELSSMGFLTRDNKWYRAVEETKVNIVRSEQ